MKTIIHSSSSGLEGVKLTSVSLLSLKYALGVQYFEVG